jgi:hypothetical protein
VTNSLFASRRVRSVGFMILCLALGFSSLPAAHGQPPKGEQGKGEQGKGGQDAGKGDPGKGKEDEAKKKQKDAFEKIKDEKKKETGETTVKSIEMEKTGVARKKIEDIRNVQRIPVAQPTRADQTAVTTGKGDKTQVRKWARYQLSLFTDPDQDRNVQKNHNDVLNLFDQDFGQDYFKLLKRELITAADEFVNKPQDPKVSTVAKVNMLSLIDELHHKEAAREVHGVEVLLNTLRNHEQHGDAVLYVTMNALANAKSLADPNRRTLTTVELERQAAKALMQIARRGELQPLLLETLCRTLGVIGVPYEGLVNELAEVATFLANIATNENLSERTRLEAAIGLGKLQKQNMINGYDFAVEAWVFAKVYHMYLNWIVANRALEQPKVSAAVIRYLGARLYDAIRQSTEQASGAPGQDRLRSLLSTIEPSLRDVFEDKDPDREPIVEWLKQNTVPALKLTRRAAEIKPVQKAAVAAQPPEAAGANK